MLNRILIPLQNIDSYCAFINSNLNISLHGDIPFRYSNYRHYTIHSLGVPVYITKKTIKVRSILYKSSMVYNSLNGEML